MAYNIRISFETSDLDWPEVSRLYEVSFGYRLPPDSLERIFMASHTVCTAHDGNRLCGAVYAISDGVLDATIHGLAVHPDYQGRGIATRMMKEIVQKLGSLAILLTTEPEYVDYYRQMGFRRHRATMALRFPDDEVE